MSGFTFPIGDSQTLSIGGLTLTLHWNRFNANGDNAWGYSRIEVIEQQATISNSLDGASIVEGNFFEPKHQFEWHLWLDPEQTHLLYAIWKEQQYRARSQQSDIAVRLQDRRLTFMGRSPRIRAKVGDTINEITAPTGFAFFWAQFDVFLQIPEDFSRWFLTSSNHLFEVKLKAKELSLVSPSEDIP